MTIADINNLPPKRYPAGRETQAFVGDGRPITARGFCMGFVTLDPNGGQVPWHNHANEEVYTLLEGEAEIAVGDEVRVITAKQAVYIPSGTFHQLTNLSDQPARMMYCYSPAGDVDHWRLELAGTLPVAGADAPVLPAGAAAQKTEAPRG